MKCVNCNTDTTNPKFCSRSCSVTHQNEQNHWRKNHGIFVGLVECINCGSPLKKNSSKFCSHSCQHEHNLKEKIENGTVSARSIKRHLISTLGNRFSECGIEEWNNKPIVMELEHKNGDSSDNSLSNTCLLCPNCYSQTSTYKNKNKGNGRHARMKRYHEGKSF